MSNDSEVAADFKPIDITPPPPAPLIDFGAVMAAADAFVAAHDLYAALPSQDIMVHSVAKFLCEAFEQALMRVKLDYLAALAELASGFAETGDVTV